jgi:tRNA dimethylallyltransferase
VANYRRLAGEAIAGIHDTGRIPLLAGGTGMYVWSVLEGWDIPEVPPDADLRRQLEARAAQEGKDALYRELKEIDPAAAMKIHPNNLRRVIRALEVHHRTGKRFSETQAKHPPNFDFLIIGLTASRQRLHKAIDERVDEMIEHGLVDEVRSLLQRGYHLGLPSMQTVGYRQIGQHLQGELTLPDAIQKIKYETHRLAIHQYAWFRLSDPRIHWYDVNEEGFQDKAASLVRKRLDA